MTDFPSYREGSRIVYGYRPFVGNTCKSCTGTIDREGGRATHDRYCDSFTPCTTQEEYDDVQRRRYRGLF